MSTSQGPWSLAMASWDEAKTTPVRRMGGQISKVRLKPAKAQTSQKGMRTQKGVRREAMTPVRTWRSRPVTPWSAMVGIPTDPKATGAVLASRERPAAWMAGKPRPMRIVPQTATGVPKPAAPSKKAPRTKAMRRSWRRLSCVTPMRVSWRRWKRPALTVRR